MTDFELNIISIHLLKKFDEFLSLEESDQIHMSANLEGSDSTIQSITASFGYDHQDTTV